MKRLTLKMDHCGLEWPLRMWKGTPGYMGQSGPPHLQTCPEFSGLTQRQPLIRSEPVCSLGQGGRCVCLLAQSLSHPRSGFYLQQKGEKKKRHLRSTWDKMLPWRGEHTGGDGRLGGQDL